MTTKIIIKSPRNNHMLVGVDILQVTPKGEEISRIETTIPDGEERSFYVHTTQELRIKEVPKK